MAELTPLTELVERVVDICEVRAVGIIQDRAECIFELADFDDLARVDGDGVEEGGGDVTRRGAVVRKGKDAREWSDKAGAIERARRACCERAL